MAKITNKQAKAIKPGAAAIPAGITGLTLQPTATAGRGKWNLRYVSPVTGKRRDMGMGSYPDVDVAAALEAGEQARKLIAAGNDPIMARDAKQAIPTFEQAARARHAEVAPSFRNAKHRAQWISSLEQHVFPHIGHMKVDRLEPKHFEAALRPIWLEIPETARRVKMRCSDVMAVMWGRGHTTTGNPLDPVSTMLGNNTTKGEERHQPAMPWSAAPAFVSEHLSAAPVMGARAALLFVILTAARSGEVRGATWSEIDLDGKLWTIPKERMKAGRTHRVPLSDAAVALLRLQLHGDDPQADAWVFPAIRGGQMSDMALTSLLRRVNAPSDTPGRVATAHGFRSTFRNWAADHGYSADIAERALAHTIGNKVQAAYERTDRLDARVAMMQQWADHVMGKVAGNVVAIRGAA
jgi:integrase